MKLKIMLAIALAILLTLFITGCGKSNIISGKATQLEPIKIGAIIPQTGAASFLGEPELNGLTLAIEEINAQGGVNNRKIKLIVEDSQSDPVEAVNAANKLINIDKVNLLYTSLTGVSGALSPYAETNNMPLIYESTTAEFARDNSMAFDTYPNAYDLCKDAMELAVREGKKRFAFICLNFQASYDCERAVHDVIDGTDASLVLSEMFEMNEKDFRTSLMKAKEKNADTLIQYSYTKNNFPLFQQMLDLNINMTIICPLIGATCTGLEQVETIAQTTNLFEGALGSSANFNEHSIDPKTQRFIAAYLERFGKQPVTDAAYPYDDGYLIKEALSKCDTLTSECIRDSLFNTQIDGVTGKLVFDENGVATREVSLVHFKDGEWVSY